MASGTMHHAERRGRQPMMVVATALLAGLALLAGACQRGPRNFENENDRLRAENMQLEREVEDLQTQLDRRLAQLENLRQQPDGAPMPAADPPALADLELGNYSGGIDENDDGVDDVMRVYLRPLDQKGRLLPVAGRAVMRVVAIPKQGEPRTLAERAYDPPAFDNAWRSGFTGEHYTLEVELPDDLPENLQEVTVKVAFTQADTGMELSAQAPYRIRHDN